MTFWTSHKIAQALGKTCSKKDFRINNLHFDSRLLGPNDCFIALDKGHDYLSNTIPLTIGERDADIIVPNSHEALLNLAIHARNNSPAKRIAITGSAGKTTTKHFLTQVLSQVLNIISSDKSYNNHIGVPLTLTKLTPQTDIGIFELGSNNPGEIYTSTTLVQPDIAVITNISESHIGHYANGFQGIIDEKTSIIKGFKKGGILIIPKNLKDYVNYDNIRIVDESRIEKLDIPIQQEHHRFNMTLVLEILDLLKIPLDQINFSKLTLPQGRGNAHSLVIDGKKVTVIDDAYNAPFVGMKAALYELSKYKGRKVAILADMVELGDNAYPFHQKLIDIAKDCHIDVIIPCGKIFAELLDQPVFDTNHISSILKEGDCILFKGGRSSGLYKVVDKLVTNSSLI